MRVDEASELASIVPPLHRESFGYDDGSWLLGQDMP